MKNLNSRRILCLICWGLGVSIEQVSVAAGAGAQQSNQAPASTRLSVDEVIQLVGAGLPEDIIIAKVRKDARAFDLGASDLMRLRKAGVGDRIIRVMVDPGAEAPSADAPTQPATSGALPAPASSPLSARSRPSATAESAPLPDEVGVYWVKEKRELIRIEGLAVSNTRSGSTLVNKATLGVKKAKVNAQLNGARAELRIKERQPQFCFYLPENASIGDYLLLQLVQRPDVRQVEIGETTFWKMQSGVDHAQQIPFTHQRIRNRIYALTPSRELASGEYGFYVASGVELTKVSGRIYDFGVEP